MKLYQKVISKKEILAIVAANVSRSDRGNPDVQSALYHVQRVLLGKKEGRKLSAIMRRMNLVLKREDIPRITRAILVSFMRHILHNNCAWGGLVYPGLANRAESPVGEEWGELPVKFLPIKRLSKGLQVVQTRIVCKNTLSLSLSEAV